MNARGGPDADMKRYERNGSKKGEKEKGDDLEDGYVEESSTTILLPRCGLDACLSGFFSLLLTERIKKTYTEISIRVRRRECEGEGARAGVRGRRCEGF